MIRWKNLRTNLFLGLAVCLISTALISLVLEDWYRKAGFDQLSQICQLLMETAPETEQSLLTTLKQYQSKAGQKNEESSFLLQQGYKEKDFPINIQWYVRMIPAVSFILGSIIFVFMIFILGRQRRKRIEELTTYLEKVNLSGIGTMIQTKEDDFSLLQDEIYKTVTALYQMKEEALKVKENYADNLANIAHQMKTPLTAASVSLQLLREKEPSAYVEKIHCQLERLAALEKALLRLSRIDAGALKLECVPVDIYTVLNLAADNLYDLLVKKNITVSIQECGCATMSGDMDWTMEALLNLLKNCMEHMPGGGTIHCEYSQNPFYTEIIIWDEGVGFAKEDLPHIFERFYRGENATDSGIGIGLTFAKSIFELQNGNITARNMPSGGACFEIRVYSH
ncbi:HAMP domain-containing histidine kinase [Lachnospiraceae bacterium ZAX-1]